ACVATSRFQGFDDPATETRSSADGSYTVAVPRLGKWCVGAVHATAGNAWRSGVRVSDASPSIHVDLVLEPGFIVSGVVSDERGAPVAAVSLHVILDFGEGRTCGLGDYFTDRNGRYSTPPLPLRDREIWSVRAHGLHGPLECEVVPQSGEI